MSEFRDGERSVLDRLFDCWTGLVLALFWTAIASGIVYGFWAWLLTPSSPRC